MAASGPKQENKANDQAGKTGPESVDRFEYLFMRLAAKFATRKIQHFELVYETTADKEKNAEEEKNSVKSREQEVTPGKGIKQDSSAKAVWKWVDVFPDEPKNIEASMMVVENSEATFVKKPIPLHQQTNRFERMQIAIRRALALKSSDPANPWPDLYTDALEALRNKKGFTLSEKTKWRELWAALDSLYIQKKDVTDCVKTKKIHGFTFVTQRYSTQNFYHYSRMLASLSDTHMHEVNLRDAVIRAIGIQADLKLNAELYAKKRAQLIEHIFQLPANVTKLILVNCSSFDKMVNASGNYGPYTVDAAEYAAAPTQSQSSLNGSRELDTVKWTELEITGPQAGRHFKVYRLNLYDYEKLTPTDLQELRKLYQVYSRNKQNICFVNDPENRALQLVVFTFALLDNYADIFIKDDRQQDMMARSKVIQLATYLKIPVGKEDLEWAQPAAKLAMKLLPLVRIKMQTSGSNLSVGSREGSRQLSPSPAPLPSPQAARSAAASPVVSPPTFAAAAAPIVAVEHFAARTGTPSAEPSPRKMTGQPVRAISAPVDKPPTPKPVAEVKRQPNRGSYSPTVASPSPASAAVAAAKPKETQFDRNIKTMGRLFGQVVNDVASAVPDAVRPSGSVSAAVGGLFTRLSQKYASVTQAPQNSSGPKRQNDK